MNLTQQVKAQAEGIALKLESRVKALHYDDLRATALQNILNRLKPGMGATVAHGTVILQRQGVQPIAVALHHSLVTALEEYIWGKLEGTPGMSGCCSGMGAVSFEGFSNIMSGIREGVGMVTETTLNIVSAVDDRRDRRDERRSARAESEAYIQQQGAAPPPPPPPIRTVDYGPPPAPAAGISPLMVGAGVLGVGGIVTAIVLATRKG